MTKLFLPALLLTLSSATFATESGYRFVEKGMTAMAAEGAEVLVDDSVGFRYDPQCENCISEDQTIQRSQDSAKSQAEQLCKRVGARSVEVLDVGTSVKYQDDYLLNIGAPREFKSSVKIKCLFN